MFNWKPLLTLESVDLTFDSSDEQIFVATTSADLTSSISPGMRLRLNQTTGGSKYFIVVAITESTLTIYGGTDYILEDEAISEPMFSPEKVPFGFPADPTKWTEEVISTTTIGQGNASADTWYSMGSFSIDIPIGVWRVYWQAAMNPWLNSALEIDMFTSLSEADDSESDPDFTAAAYLRNVTGNQDLIATTFREKVISLDSKTTYYLISKTSITNTNLYLNSTRSRTIVRAVCAYL